MLFPDVAWACIGYLQATYMSFTDDNFHVFYSFCQVFVITSPSWVEISFENNANETEPDLGSLIFVIITVCICRLFPDTYGNIVLYKGGRMLTLHIGKHGYINMLCFITPLCGFERTMGNPGEPQSA